jgi:ABC-type sugar transport system permease subunit
VTLRHREAALPYLFIAPAVGGLVVFRLYPMVLALWQSLHREALDGTQRFVGLANYLAVVSDAPFWNAVRVTALFNVVINPLQVALALGLALLVNRRLPGIALFRTAYFLPMTVSLTITAIISRSPPRSSKRPASTVPPRGGASGPSPSPCCAGCWPSCWWPTWPSTP